MSKEQLTKEMGDVLWYLSQVAEWNDINFDDVAKYNIQRLRNKKNKLAKKIKSLAYASSLLFI